MKNLILIFSFIFTLSFSNTIFASNKGNIDLVEESNKELFLSSDKVDVTSELESAQRPPILIIIKTDKGTLIIFIGR